MFGLYEATECLQALSSKIPPDWVNGKTKSVLRLKAGKHSDGEHILPGPASCGPFMFMPRRSADLPLSVQHWSAPGFRQQR